MWRKDLLRFQWGLILHASESLPIETR